MTPAGYPVPAIPDVLVVMTQPLVVISPAGPTNVDPAIPRPSTGLVGCSSVIPSLPGCLRRRGASHPGLLPWTSVFGTSVWSGSSFGGESAGCPLPPASLTPRPSGAFPHVGESDADGGSSGVPDLSREGPFAVHQDRPHSGASPRLLDGIQGCRFRMTSYDEEHSGPDFTPAYVVQLHDPLLLEYVGAPESARLLSRSLE